VVSREALLDRGVRACFLISGGNLDLFTHLSLWLVRAENSVMVANQQLR
jgi:hypothetical protein